MQAKLKGLSGIKGLALQHGEKIAIAVVGLLAAWFIYSSLSLPSLDDQYQVDKLQSQISETKVAMDGTSWPEATSEVATEVRFYTPIAKKGAKLVNADEYPIGGLDAPVVAPTLLRTDPLVLNAVEVKVTATSGLFAFKDEKTRQDAENRLKIKEEEREAEQLRRNQQNQGEAGEAGGEGGRRPGGRRGEEGAEFGAGEFDPEHPNRRRIEGVAAPAGVPLQGGERLDRVAWATIVAKVPIREQLKLFQDAFQNARGYNAQRDFPQYVGFVVERSEVGAGQATPWQRIPVYDGQKKLVGKFYNGDAVTKLAELASTDWAGPTLEPVDARYTDALLTMPLPPLVGRDFGADATHPDIPLAKDAPPEEDVLKAQPAAGATEEPAEGDDDTAFSASAAGPRPGGQYQAPQGVPGMSGREFMGERGYPSGPMMSERGYPSGPMMSERGGSPYAGGAAGGISAGRTELPQGVDFLLLRFFDFKVEPGKKYKYRVKVVVSDPNYGIPKDAGVLDAAVVDRQMKESNAAKAKKQQVPWFRMPADWAEASGVVGIPVGGGAVRVAEGRIPSIKLHNDEPAVKLFAEKFDVEEPERTAIHVAIEKEVRRGSVMNFNEKMKYSGENDLWVDTKDSFELYTGLTVLDVDGAEKVSKDKVAPTRVLLMDDAGQLTIRDQMADGPDVRYLRHVFGDDKRRGRPEEGPGMGPEGNMFRGGRAGGGRQ